MRVMVTSLLNIITLVIVLVIKPKESYKIHNKDPEHHRQRGMFLENLCVLSATSLVDAMHAYVRYLRCPFT